MSRSARTYSSALRQIVVQTSREAYPSNAGLSRLSVVRAMVFTKVGTPLREVELPQPVPGPGQVRLRIHACGVCRTDLHIVDGELTEPKLPVVLGHQIVGTVVGEDRRVGIPWLGWTDGECRYCRSGKENLCNRAQFTGYDLDGGYGDYAVADERF